MKHGKKYREGAKLIDRQKLYEVNEALDLAVKTAPPSLTRPLSSM